MPSLEAYAHYSTIHQEPGQEARFIWRVVAIERVAYDRFSRALELQANERQELVRAMLRTQHIEYERAEYEDGHTWNSDVVPERTESHAIFRQRAFSWN